MIFTGRLIKVADKIQAIFIREMKVLVIGKRIQKKLQFFMCSLVSGISEMKILAVKIIAIVVARLQVQLIGLPSYFPEFTRKEPVIVVTLSNVKNGFMFCCFRHF